VVYWFYISFNKTLADCRGQAGVIRLLNGSATSEGEVQYCRNSVWTPVCGDTWGENEAAVACRQLGFAGEGTDTGVYRINMQHDMDAAPVNKYFLDHAVT